MPQYAMAQSGSAAAAASKQATASSWWKAYDQTSPRSNHSWACGDAVVTARPCVPRS